MTYLSASISLVSTPLPKIPATLPTPFSFFGGGGVGFLWRGIEKGLLLCMPGCPGAQTVNQAGLELRYPPVSDSQTLGLKVLATTSRLFSFFGSRVAVIGFFQWINDCHFSQGADFLVVG